MAEQLLRGPLRSYALGLRWFAVKYLTGKGVLRPGHHTVYGRFAEFLDSRAVELRQSLEAGRCPFCGRSFSSQSSLRGHLFASRGCYSRLVEYVDSLVWEYVTTYIAPS